MNLLGTTTDGKPFELPVEQFTTKACALIGIRGSGKTYGAEKIAEILDDAGKQIIVLDPVGVWYSLRLGSDKGRGLDVTIFGGLHGDIPLQRHAGALIADVLIDRGISAVIDVSQFETDADKTKFATDFADRFYFRKKSASVKTPVHIFVEEAQEFIPQNIQRGEERMLHVWQRMIRLGRNFKIGVSMISQRPQDVNKKALNQAEWVFAFQLRGTQERKAVEDWIANNGIDEKLAQRLPSLVQGEAYVWSPTTSTIVRIAKKRTFDASSDLSNDETAVEPKPLKSADLEKLREVMAASIEEQKANDPKELKRQIAELQKQVKAKSVESPKKGGIIVDYDNAKAYEGIVNRAVAARDKHWQSELAKVTKVTTRTKSELTALRDKLNNILGYELPSVETPQIVSITPARPVAQLSPRPAPVRIIAAGGDGSLSKAERAILLPIVQYAGSTMTRARISCLSGYSVSSSSFSNALSALRIKGFISGMGDEIRATDAGVGAAGDFDPIPTGEELQRYWMARVGKAESALLAILIRHYPGHVTKDIISEESGYSITSSSFANALSKLRMLQLAEGFGSVKASDNLFD